MYDVLDPVPPGWSTGSASASPSTRCTPRSPNSSAPTTSPACAATRPPTAQTITFTSARLTTMVTVTVLSPDRVRVDGWVAPGGGVRGRTAARDETAEHDRRRRRPIRVRRRAARAGAVRAAAAGRPASPPGDHAVRSRSDARRRPMLPRLLDRRPRVLHERGCRRAEPRPAAQALRAARPRWSRARLDRRPTPTPRAATPRSGISIALNTAELTRRRTPGWPSLEAALRRAVARRRPGAWSCASHSQRALDRAARRTLRPGARRVRRRRARCSSTPTRNDQFADPAQRGQRCACTAASWPARAARSSAPREFARPADMPDGRVQGRCTTSATSSSWPATCPRALRADGRSAGRSTSTICRSGSPLLDRARVLAEAGLVREADESLAARRRDLPARPAGPGPRRDRARAGPLRADRRRRCRRRGASPMRARDRFRRRGNDRWRRSAELVLLQGDLAAGRPGARLDRPGAAAARRSSSATACGCRRGPRR